MTFKESVKPEIDEEGIPWCADDELLADFLDEDDKPRKITPGCPQHTNNNGPLFALTGECICELVEVDHFACFPPALVAPLIKASTSEVGCCVKCGEQWRRVVDRKGNTIAWELPCADPITKPFPCTVGDSFAGAGSTEEAARELGREFVGCELNPDYIEMSKRRAV